MQVIEHTQNVRYIDEPVVNAMLTWPSAFFFWNRIVSTRLQRLFQTVGVSVNVHSAGQNKLLRGCPMVRLDPRLPEMGNRDDCAVIRVKSRCESFSVY
jgi:hypothetical protein